MPKTAIAVANTKKPATAERKTAVERPHKNLTQTQEEIADLASNMLLNGGARQDLDLLLTALARHQYRNMSFARGPLDRGSSSADEINARAEERAALLTEDWYRDLARHWPEPKAEAEGFESGSVARPVTEMVSANIRASARQQFDQFLTDVHGIEPVWLVNEILENVNSGSDMGEAIYYPMDRAEIYVRVPWEHRQRIEEFVAFLEKGESD